MNIFMGIIDEEVSFLIQSLLDKNSNENIIIIVRGNIREEKKLLERNLSFYGKEKSRYHRTGNHQCHRRECA